MTDAGSHLDTLLDYAETTGLITSEDRIWAANVVLSTLGLAAPAGPGERGETGSADTRTASDMPAADSEAEAAARRGAEAVLAPLLDDAVVRGLIEDTPDQRDALDAAIMGSLTERPSSVIADFWADYDIAAVAASDGFFGLCVANNYIHAERTDRNPRWMQPSRYGELVLTINLAKPEKDPRDIAAARNVTATGYPECLLCAQNEGYAGRVDHPARQNLRLIPLALADESWFLQYSPYQYYLEHCIVLRAQHVPMQLTRLTFTRLLEFVTEFPHYFLGSNADLPIVGGSILNHDHFQGGRFRFPMQDARPVAGWHRGELRAQVLDWPLSVVRISGADAVAVGDAGFELLTAWRSHDEPDTAVAAFTGTTPHNTVTPVAHRTRDGYQLDVVLRNNRTSDEHPDGIFHPHAEIHPVKRENIGLIEVMGLAVLPGRLASEMAGLAQALASGTELPAALVHHAPMLEQLRAADGAPDALVRAAVGDYFRRGLEHCSVLGLGEDALPRWERLVAPLGWARS